MGYICTYFNTKIGAIGKLLDVTKDAWDNRLWLTVVLMMLWTLFCTVVGALLTPIDFIYGAIMWHKHPGYRDVLEDLADEMMFD